MRQMLTLAAMAGLAVAFGTVPSDPAPLPSQALQGSDPAFRLEMTYFRGGEMQNIIKGIF